MQSIQNESPLRGAVTGAGAGAEAGQDGEVVCR